MNKELFRILEIILGVFLIIIGIFSLFLPFLQGFLFIIIGLALISRKPFKKYIKNLRKKWHLRKS